MAATIRKRPSLYEWRQSFRGSGFRRLATERDWPLEYWLAEPEFAVRRCPMGDKLERSGERGADRADSHMPNANRNSQTDRHWPGETFWRQQLRPHHRLSKLPERISG